MEKIVGFLMRRKHLVSLVVVLIIICGIIAVAHTNRESIPQLNLDMVTITTIYPGASPSDAEELISIPIEKKLRKVGDLDKVRSYNVENVSVIVIYIEDNAKDKKKVVQDIKDAVEQVDNLPSRAEKPVVKEITTDNTELISIAFTGKTPDVDYSRLREFANRSENFFYKFKGVGEIEKYGYFDREYLVEVNPDALEKYRLGMNSIVGTLAARNVDYPGGPLRIGQKEFVLRTKGQFKDAEDVRNTVIMSNDFGHATRIRDVAKVTDTFKEADEYRRFNGQQAIIYTLYKKRSADEIELAGRIKEGIKKYTIPGFDDVKITAFNDKSKTTSSRISSVLEEAAIGFTILGLFMVLLLGSRMSHIVLAGIPVSFMVTFFVMNYLGITFNIVSLFGMIMVLGMIVDFSIVVAENSHRYMEQGVKRATSIERGTGEVFWAVTTTLICIVAAFMPLLLVSGMIGKFVRAIPIVIITALIASWFISMFFLPTYLYVFLPDTHSSLKKDQPIPIRIIGFLTRCFSTAIPGMSKKNKKANPSAKKHVQQDTEWFVAFQKKYKLFVTLAVRHRYVTVGILCVLLVISLSLIPAIGFKFLTNGGEEEIRLTVKLPHETNLAANLDEMKKFEGIIMTIPSQELVALHTWVGEEWSSELDPKPGKATYKTTFEIHLPPEKERKRTAETISTELREKIATAKDKGILSKDMTVKSELVFLGPPVGKPVNVEISGDDYGVMKKIAKEYSDYLETIHGVSDIAIDLEEGKTEFRYGVNEETAAWSGVSAYDIAVALNASFQGAVATKVNRGQEEQGVRVRFDENARQHMRGLQDVKIATRMGGLVTLDSVSTVKAQNAYSQINRLNFMRLVQVQANVDIKKITPGKVTDQLNKKFADIETRYPGYSIRYGGEQEDTDKSMSELSRLFIIAIGIIFLVITIFFRSLILPMVVMIAVPFALVGVVFAEFVHHQPFSFMSTLGLFSLAGIIVSNTLLLVQFINKFRESGMPIGEAIVEGGVARLRPIILTAGSMVLELLPVMYGVGGKDYLVAPLALAFGYGLLFATFITLIIVPCFYHIAEDMKTAISKYAARFGIKINPSIYSSEKEC